jgi:hypothetical protein
MISLNPFALLANNISDLCLGVPQDMLTEVLHYLTHLFQINGRIIP